MKVIHKEKSSSDKPTKYFVLGLDDWDYFESLVSFLEKYYGAHVDGRDDGINTRSWQLRCQGEYLMLEHNEDIGNCFYSCVSGGESKLTETIAKDLEDRLKDTSYE